MVPYALMGKNGVTLTIEKAREEKLVLAKIKEEIHTKDAFEKYEIIFDLI